MLARHAQPIAAIATAPGRGAVGIVRVSGQGLAPLVEALLGRPLVARMATYLPFPDAQGQAIDRGLALHLGGIHPAGNSARGRVAAPVTAGAGAACLLHGVEHVLVLPVAHDQRALAVLVGADHLEPGEEPRCRS